LNCQSARPSDPVGIERNRFVCFRTAYTFDCFVDLPRTSHLKILDFGFGEGHSIAALLAGFPMPICRGRQLGAVLR
jgi:hypothetical protein